MRKQLLAVVLMLACLPSAKAVVVIDTVPVGNPGNANDTHGDGYGGVAYTYNIGKYEVTAGQYTEFLNAAAVTDTYGLYSLSMADTTPGTYGSGCNIVRSGVSGSYTYSVAANWANRPVNSITWDDAARFANWMHNGQPTGAQDLTTTEDGSYYLNGATTDEELMLVVRKPDATWVIPTEDEWYKAAYHYNDGATGNYFDYPTSNDNVPDNALVDPDPGNNATFSDSVDEWTIGPPYYRTEVGEHENSRSPYGTFNQAGNVLEWNEAIVPFGEHLYRGARAGSFRYNGSNIHADFRRFTWPTNESYIIGLRVAEVPRPARNRYVSFEPESGVGELAYSISLTDGREGWVGVPQSLDWGGVDPATVSLVVDAPVFRTWTESTVHVTGCVVVPDEQYPLRSTSDGINFSVPQLLETVPAPSVGSWADIVGGFDNVTMTWSPPNGFVNFQDISASVKKFQVDPTAPHVTVVDLHPQWPNYAVNFSDINMVIKGFQNIAYPVPAADCQTIANCPLGVEAGCLP